MKKLQKIIMTPAAQHEVESSEIREVDLHKHVTSCEKNPGHQQFIRISDLTINDMPGGHRDLDLYQFIRATADLTVRVNVTYISPCRPSTWPGTSVPFPFADKRGTTMRTNGSGRVYCVNKHSERDVKAWGACSCDKCKDSDTPSSVWGEVQVYTATHVVYDSREAAAASCRFFFDSENSPLVTLRGWTVMDNGGPKFDRCEIKHVTCDLDLLNRLHQIWKEWEALWWRVFRAYKESGRVERLAFIVSHPHGCPKHVTIGEWTERTEMKDWVTKYAYTTSTCKGSSGAFVYIMGCESWLAAHVHSGVDSQGRNFSGYGWG